MAGHGLSNCFFSLRVSDRGTCRGPTPVWLDTQAWLSTQGPPGRLMVQPKVDPDGCPGPEVWGVPLGPPPYQFQGGMIPCGTWLKTQEAGPWLQNPAVSVLPRPCTDLQCTPNLALPEDVSAIKKEIEQLAKELRQKRLALGYSQADVGFSMGALFGKMLSQTTICRFEAQQLSLANMWKLQPLLKMWLKEVDTENLLGLCKMETIMQQSRKQRRASKEKRIGNILENLFLQCPKPTPQQMSIIAGRLRLQKDLVRVWFYNRSRMGSWPFSAAFPLGNVGLAGPPVPGGPVCFPLATGVHFGFPYQGVPYLTPLYSPTPISARGPLLSAHASVLGFPVLSI
ncbi:PREDICTED: POU domain, class 5, transcription factor 2 [Elephantulus edwardii]|uniref:POU domain, class 5, transcription factor 2 n=1 Tax=Elephantulus edwardii TaxID=28737 RepID=UPI0003F0CA79|nr:PREDICTED: POU domain, class 5, transcription factor 2 [Elephantulus edwardii]